MNKLSTKFFLLSGWALLLLAVLTPCHSQPLRTDTDASNLSSLQGHWQGTGPGGECSVTIEGKSLEFRAREDFWYETTFTLPAGTDPPQLHATIIRDSSGREDDIGTVVVAVFKVEDETLTLIVIDSFEEPPQSPVATESDWAKIEANWTLDRYSLHRAQPSENDVGRPHSP